MTDFDRELAEYEERIRSWFAELPVAERPAKVHVRRLARLLFQSKCEGEKCAPTGIPPRVAFLITRALYRRDFRTTDGRYWITPPHLLSPSVSDLRAKEAHST